MVELTNFGALAKDTHDHSKKAVHPRMMFGLAAYSSQISSPPIRTLSPLNFFLLNFSLRLTLH